MHLNTYNEQLRHLTLSIVEMGGLVKEMIASAFESLIAKDDELKDHIRGLDRKVNLLDRSINEQATMMLALRSPMGDDLRFVTSALGIASDLEHAGDLAKNTGKRSLKLGSYAPDAVIAKLKDMQTVILAMIGDALTAIEQRDPDLAIDVWKRDKAVDDIYHEVLKLLQEDMQKNPDSIEAITHFVFANKNFERIADYATSLSRTVYYVTTGKQPDKEVLKGK